MNGFVSPWKGGGLGFDNEALCPKCGDGCLYIGAHMAVTGGDVAHEYGLHSEWGGFVYRVWCASCGSDLFMVIDPRHGNIRVKLRVITNRAADTSGSSERVYTIEQLRGAWGAGFHQGKESR